MPADTSTTKQHALRDSPASADSAGEDVVMMSLSRTTFHALKSNGLAILSRPLGLCKVSGSGHGSGAFC